MGGSNKTVGPLGTGSNTSGGGGRSRGPVGIDPRAQAKSLGAGEARDLLKASLPYVLDRLTSSQIQQMQRVLDAAVVDPVVVKEANAIYASGTKYYGSIVVKDEATMRRGDKAMKKYIAVDEGDKRIRLDYKQLLDPTALKPTTDNPDEADYLEKVKNTLEKKGVWLRFAAKWVKDPEDPSRTIIDYRQFEVWLSLGPNGDTIPTKDGKLTRETLLGTTLLGAGYWENVHRGPVQRELDRQISHLRIDIEAGLEQHQQLAKMRRDAFVGVTEISDALGGADFPDTSIWDEPHKLVLKAMDLNVNGNVKAAQVYLVTAAVVTRNAAHLVWQYIEDTSSGAERAVKVLKVARTAGKVAEVGLAVTGVVGIARAGAALIGGEAAAGDAAVDKAAEQLVKQYVAKNPEIAGELGQVRWVPGPKGSVAGGVKAGTSSGAGTGWHQW